MAGGTHVGHQIRVRGRYRNAEQIEHAPRSALMAHLRELVDNLSGREFTNIAIEPFAVEDDSGARWGLIDETAEYGFSHAELRPDRLGFNPLWNGEYDA